MEMTLKEKYGKFFTEMAAVSHAAAKIDESKVYEEANPETRKYMDMILRENFLAGSGLGNIENFKAFYNAVANEGKRGLILMEHYTNLDLPAIVYLLQNQGEDWASDLASRIVAVAGMKLNEASPMVRAFAEGFTRVVIYPTRSLNAVESRDSVSSEEKAEEEKRARKINLSAMRAMDDCKKRGQVILVFPSGTRYRPGNMETKKGLREIDSYLRLFDVMILVSINGNCLHINPYSPDDMLSDIVRRDKVVLTASPVMDCKSYRKQVLDSLPPDEPDPKQKTVDGVMEILARQHDEAELLRGVHSVSEELSSVSYPGRGIIAGRSEDGRYAVSAYWTMGRSTGSRNRIFVEEGEGIRTQAFDPSLVAGDPSLIIYSAVKVLGKKTIVTNGDQTDTVFEGMKKGLTFEQSLRGRKYEHDEPNFTPRISSVLDVEDGRLSYALSILKSDGGDPECTLRQTFEYENPAAGEGRYIHTYMNDGNPLPSFAGEPVKVGLRGNIDEFAELIWNSLDKDNKVSLFVRYIDIATGKYESRIINKNR